MLRLLLIFFLFPAFVFSQVCPQPKYFCSNVNFESDFVSYNSNAVIDVVINDNTCGIGGNNVNWACPSGGIQNETWLIIKVNQTNVQNLPIKIGTYTHININAAAWGPYNTTAFDACNAMFEPASDCKGTSQEIFLTLKNAYPGAIYFVGIRNESNQNDKYIINTWNNTSTTTIKHFVPQTQNCVLPTAEFISENLLIREEERQHFIPRIQFTGTPPFYFSIEDGIYEYTGTSNTYDWPTYMHPDWSFDIDLNTVRNSCGAGTVIKNKIDYLIYSRDKRLVSCIPFDNSLDDEQSGQSFESSKFLYVDDRSNKPNSAVGLNGIDDYLLYPGRDLLGENYVMKLWVKPEISSSNSQTILSLGTEDTKSQKLELVNGEFLFTAKLRGNRTYQVTVPATMDVWQQISLIKDSTKISINSNLFGKNSLNQNDFEVPDYGLYSKLLIGKDIPGSKYFKGAVDHFKYFSGQFTDAQLNQIFSSEFCSLAVCDTVPQMRLPGFVRENPGISKTYNYSTIESFYLDKLVYQIGNSIPKTTYAWSKNSNPNAPYSGSNFEQYTFKLQQDNIYEKFTHLSGSCGSGKFLDTMHFYTAPYPVRCYNLNNSFNDYYEYTSTSNISQYNQSAGKTSANFTSSSFLSTDVTGGDTRNYSVSFRFQASNLMNLNQIYDFFSYQLSSQNEDRLYFEKLSNSYSRITFQKQQSTNSFSYQIPTLSDGWHHIAVVFRSGNNFSVGTIQLFLDNVLLINTQTNIIYDYNTSAKFSFGKKTGTIRNSFIGTIDDIKLFDGAITASDVASLYNSTTECPTSLCDNVPFFSLIDKGELIFNYGEKISINAQIGGLGPFKLKYNVNDRTTFNEAVSKPNLTLPYLSTDNSMYNMGNNYFKIQNIENHCFRTTNSDSIPFYIKPKLLECLPFDGSVINTAYTNATFSGLIMTNDRFETPNSAIRFESNGNLSFVDNNLKPTAIFYSVWIKPENVDSLVLFKMGNALNYYSAILIRSGSGFKILAKRNGSNFLSSTIKSAMSLSTINSGVWTQISIQFVFNGFEIYINGNLDVNTKTVQGQIPDFYNFPLTYSIGTSFENFRSFRGSMDAVKFIHGELNQYEKNAVYNSKGCDFQYCPPQRIIPAVVNTPSYYQSSKSLDVSSKVNAKTLLYAGNSILLKNGFEAKNTIFSAEIKNCPN